MFSFFFNNIILNNVFIWLKAEKYLKHFNHPYLKFKADRNKTLQETAGFSNRPEINEALAAIHTQLINTAKKYLPVHSKVLDIGCGPGLYLKDFDSTSELVGIDINADMIRIASVEVPHAKFYCGDFMKITPNEKYHLIYSIGMLIYIARNDLEIFFEKIYHSLLPGGILFLSYPHAISKKDLYYPDLSYIQYSPALIEKIASEKFLIIEHYHSFDRRKIGNYDTRPYKSDNPLIPRTYKNSYLLIAQKNHGYSQSK